MKKKLAWIMAIFMLFASFELAVETKASIASVTEQQEAGDEWRLTAGISFLRSEVCRTETRYENLLNRNTAAYRYSFGMARGLLILLGWMVLCLLNFIGRGDHGRILAESHEPVRMRAVRYIHFAYAL